MATNTAASFTNHTGNGTAGPFNISFSYLSEAEVDVTVGGVLKTITTHYTFTSATQITFTSGNEPANGVAIKFQRDTNISAKKVDFADGSVLTEADLDANSDQVLFAQQEIIDKLGTIEENATGDQTAAEIRTLVESASDSNVFTDADHTKLNNIESNATADQTISEIKSLIAGSPLDASHLAANSVDSSELVDGSVDTSHLSADCVTNAKIADDSIDSEHYVDGSIDTAHIGNSQVTTNKIANSNVTTAKIADDAVTTSKISNLNVTTAKIAHNAINSNKLATDSVTTTAIADNAVTTAKINGSAVTTARLANGAVTSDKIAASAVGTPRIADDAVTTAKIADAELKTLAGMQSATASKLADSTALTSDIADLNQIDGLTKQTTISDSDASFPTSGAVVDYVAAQLAPIGGLEVIATDAAFPNTQPQSGVVISIADAGGLVVNSSGTSTTARTVGGSTVTINNFASNFNSSTIDNGVAVMVSSTGSGQVYNYHKATLKEADLLSLSNDINDFAARYRVTAGEPTSNNDEGDLIYDKNADKMKVFDSTLNAFKEVTSVGDFKFLFLCPTGGSGSPTINGSIATYDLREGSTSGSAASVTNAAQLLVSINGVIQKPNTGTSAPSEGFAMVDSNTIIFGTNLPTGAEVFVIQIGSAISLQVPADNTVATAKLQNGSVTTAKITDSAVTSAKIADGSIVNADINASAAIAGTKISPNFGSQTVTTTGNLNAKDIILTDTDPSITFTDSDDNPDYRIFASAGRFKLKDATNNVDRVTLDSTGRVGIGTTSPSHKLDISADGVAFPSAAGSTVLRLRNSGGSTTLSIDSNAGNAGAIQFGDTDVSSQGTILYHHASNHMQFNTVDTERMRIDSSGRLLIGTTDTTPYNNSGNNEGVVLTSNAIQAARQGDIPFFLNRLNDSGGTLAAFYRNGSQQGTISVSGSTVSYNGGHLSRWSQIKGLSTTDKTARPIIYQGTVMSNLDDLCVWDGEDNQQLNMTKISDTEGDKDVAGVFYTWDDDDDKVVNDFYIAMTGDMVIRVAASTTVARGDLLISAGDGTAKPQADDIVRSSTIAKIISTTFTATYADGSKAYPCVLMAC